MSTTPMPVYVKLAENLCDDIVSGRYHEYGRIPSVRDLAITYEVNNITALHTFEYLTEKDIIFKRRGEGYFVKEGAVKLITDSRRRNFYDNILPQLFVEMKKNGITIDEVAQKYNESLTKNEEGQQ